MASPICTDCPPVGKLRRLIDGTIPPDEQSSITNHLDACESCQCAIQHLAAGGSGLLDYACDAERERPSQTSAYWPALRELEREVVKIPHSSMEVTRMSEDNVAVLEAEPSLHFLDEPEHPGTIGKLGRFHVVELLGRGGMGLVLRAKDVCLQREVALKVLDPTYSKNELARNRFMREARAAASITHENVVAVHHVEKHREEFPYLVMRLVAGESLQARLDVANGPLPVREIVQIGRQIAAGLAAAHEQGLIHRDIKPANILLEWGTGKVMLTDFGLARAVEDAKLTQTGFVAGTPLYMSPEQANGKPLDHRTDLFSLGSVLYAMSTGSPPFQGTSPLSVLREVTDGRPRPIREVNPEIPEDLAGVIDLLLEKKPADRIQSAAAVVDLLDHVEARLPVDETAATRAKRASRILPRLRCARYYRYAAMAALVLLGVNAVLLVTELTNLTHLTVLSSIPAAGDASNNVVIEGHPSAETPLRPRLELDAGTGPIWAVAFSPDGKTVAMGVDDGTVRLWDSQTGRPISRIKVQDGPVWSVVFNNTGNMFATVGDTGRVRLWDPVTSQELDTIVLPGPVRSAAFSPDGKRLVAGTRHGDVRVFSVDGGRQLMAATGHRGSVTSVAWSHDGKLIATAGAGGDPSIKIWDVSGDECKEVETLTGHTGGVHSVAFDPSRPVVASGSWDRTIRLWDIDKGKEIARLSGHSQDVWSVGYCCSGKVLASGSEDRTAKLWDAMTGQELRTFGGEGGAIYTVSIAPDGKTLATGSRDGTVKLWDTGRK